MSCGKQVHVITRMLKRLVYLSWSNVDSFKLICESQGTKQSFSSLYSVVFVFFFFKSLFIFCPWDLLCA